MVRGCSILNPILLTLIQLTHVQLTQVGKYFTSFNYFESIKKAGKHSTIVC